MKILASRLKNKIEIFKREPIDTELGISFEDRLLKTVWADIKFQSGNTESDGTRRASNTKFKIRIRKISGITTDCYIKYKGNIFEIEYIYPDFKNNSFIDLMAKIKEE